MAQQPSPTAPSTGSTLNPSRYTEERSPQFVGGNVDPTSGNLIPGDRNASATGTITPSSSSDAPTSDATDAPLTPALSTTTLGQISAAPLAQAVAPAASSSNSSLLTSILGAGALALGSSKNSFSNGPDTPKSGSSSFGSQPNYNTSTADTGVGSSLGGNVLGATDTTAPPNATSTLGDTSFLQGGSASTSSDDTGVSSGYIPTPPPRPADAPQAVDTPPPAASAPDAAPADNSSGFTASDNSGSGSFWDWLGGAFSGFSVDF